MKGADFFRTDDKIEIQVSSVLLGAWAEIEHDIRYKPRTSPFEDLHKLLDDLNVHILRGELIIKEIYRDYRQRTIVARGATADTRMSTVPRGSLIKHESRGMYWYAKDGRRYIFPTENTLRTWFPVLPSHIPQISAEELKLIPVGGNVTYRPGVRLIKIPADPKMYAVEKGGRLRWLKSELVAEALYGKDWHTLVDELPDAYFVNYFIGSDITTAADHDPEKERMSVSEQDIGMISPSPMNLKISGGI